MRSQTMCMAEVNSAKSPSVASRSSNVASQGMSGGSNQPNGAYSRRSELTLGMRKKYPVGYYGNAISGRVQGWPRR